MNEARVYVWHPDPAHPLGGRVRLETVPFEGLESRWVRVRDAKAVGPFLFDPSRGGKRVDRGTASPEAQESHQEAARFGEVNAAYHLDRVAAYVDGLLRELGAVSLPRVTVVVGAHPAGPERDGTVDGTRHKGRWRPFQGGHYRLPGPRLNIRELDPVAPEGEIHLGPGWELLEHGALVQAAGAPYRHNASHNAGILYHEYGHHLTRHVADFQGNDRRPPGLQENQKTSIDEGVSDYLAAVMLDSPHIWAWHRRHDGAFRHRRSLLSPRTMEEFQSGPDADIHANGTIWAASLWDLRTRMGDPRATDLLVMKSLLLSRDLYRRAEGEELDRLRTGDEGYAAGLDLLLRADAELNAAAHRGLISSVFAARGLRVYRNAGLSH